MRKPEGTGPHSCQGIVDRLDSYFNPEKSDHGAGKLNEQNAYLSGILVFVAEIAWQLALLNGLDTDDENEEISG